MPVLKWRPNKDEPFVSVGRGGTCAGGMTASILVTGLSESDTVTATKDGKTIKGKWVPREVATQVPVMTSDTTPLGVASAKSVLTTYYPYQAFDGNSVSYTTSAHGDAQDWWVAYNFGFAVTVDSFDFAPVGPASIGYWNRFPATVSLQGSNDGDVWNTIQDFETNNPGGTTEPPQTKTFTVSNPQTYSQYRLFWKTLTSDNDGYAGCSTIQFYGTTLEKDSRHEITGIADRGMWTVMATNGEDTATQDVLVDSAADFDVEMSYEPNYLMLYNAGDECEEITGGWGGGYTSTYHYSGVNAATKNSDSFYGVSDIARIVQLLGTQNKISFEGYKLLAANMNATKIANNSGCAIMFGTAKTTESGDDVGSLSTSALGKSFYNSDVSDSQEQYYVYFTSDHAGRGGYLYHCFLLKEDDWNSIATLAGVTANSIDELLAKSEMLLSESSIVKHMLSKCTGEFMFAAVRSTTFLSALNASPHKNLVLANKHWAKFLAMVGVTA